MKIYGLVLGLSTALAGLVETPASAALISQLDFTEGSITLKSGSSTVLSSSFIRNGTFVMEEYQPSPSIMTPLTVGTLAGPYTISLFSSGPHPFPSSSTSGNIISADLASLSAGLAGPFLPSSGLSLNIGGQATGLFNVSTNAFSNLTWSHVLTGSGFPTGWTGLSLQFSLNGTAQPAPVPLPAAAVLFGSGLIGLVSFLRRRAGTSQT